MSNELTTITNKHLSVFDESQYVHWYSVAQKLAQSDMIPKAYKGKPMDIMISIDMGKQVGLPMMQALQSIAVINGFPSLYGDAPLAICQQHPAFEWIKEEIIEKDNEIFGYKCTVKRRNNEPRISMFTKDDAKKAGLLGKPGPWSQYTSRMLQMRARGFALRDTFPDALKGIHIAEEVQDVITIDGEYTPKQTQQEKFNALLQKKGLNNANTCLDEDSSHISNPAVDAHDGGLCNSYSNPAPQADEAEICNEVASDGESKASVAVTQNPDIKCSEEQLEHISLIMLEKSFSAERRLKALKRFGVNEFAELSVEQATKMISMLEKAE